jgi:XTP/dITP diphosphohydrolase
VKEIVVATKNHGKVAEIAAVIAELPTRVMSLAECGDIPEAVEDGKTFWENAILKAKHYALYTKKVCLADDSGLEVDALAGAPGVYSARFAGDESSDAANNKKLLAELQGIPADKRTARFRCVLALVDNADVLFTVDGVCEGIILDTPRGQEGFGYDPLFLIPRLGKTLAELTLAEKNAISHRGQALENMADKLVRYLK